MQNRGALRRPRPSRREPDSLPASHGKVRVHLRDLPHLGPRAARPFRQACNHRRGRGGNAKPGSDRGSAVGQRLPDGADRVPRRVYRQIAFERRSRPIDARRSRAPCTSGRRPRFAPRRCSRVERRGDRPGNPPAASEPSSLCDRSSRNRFAPSRRHAGVARGRPPGHTPPRDRLPGHGRVGGRLDHVPPRLTVRRLRALGRLAPPEQLPRPPPISKAQDNDQQNQHGHEPAD